MEQTPPLSTAGGDGEDQRPPTPGREGQHGVSLLGFLEKQDSLSQYEQILENVY